MGNGLRTQARRLLRKLGGASVSPSIRIIGATLRTLVAKASGSLQTQSNRCFGYVPGTSQCVAQAAIVGDHRSVIGRFVWTLLLAVLLMQCQGSPRTLQRLWREGCHLDRLCCERVPCWGVVPVDVGV